MINLNNLDPDTFKNSLKTYLKNQTVFKDYDFEDSNLSILLDVLSHNTYFNNFYKNMIFAESQLDSARLRDNVVSKAKELNYVPYSRSSSKAVVDIELTATGNNTIDLPKGTLFSGRLGINSYQFTTDRDYIAKSSNNTFVFKNVIIFEGSYIADSYIVNSTIENQEFIISNKNIDLSSLSVYVVTDNGSNRIEYQRKNNTYGLTKNDEIFFVEGFSEDRYKIIFGNDILGKYPPNEAVILLVYRVSEGTNLADGIKDFNLDEDIASLSNASLDTILVDTIAVSAGGGERESINSIKYNAPRHFTVQEAASTAENYKSLILSKFSSILDDVAVYGGEELTPPRYGKIIVTVKASDTDITSDTIKNEIYSFLNPLKVGAASIIITDPELLFLDVSTTVTFDPSKTLLQQEDIKTLTITEVISYFDTYLQKFGADFRFSKFCAMIDLVDTSIVSNDTTVKIVKKIYPSINSNQLFNIEFGNPIESVSSTEFDWIKDSVVYKNCFVSDDNGIISIKRYDNQVLILVETNIGTVDYVNGNVNLNKFLVDYYNTVVKIKAVPKQNDIIADSSKLIYLDIDDLSVSLQYNKG